MFNVMKINLIMFILLAFIVACSDDTAQQQMLKQAVAIENADECHLCGMIISNFPGPKGELYESGSEQVNKFCSTRDLFSYLLQPENQRQVRQIFVHDMSKTPWQKPEDQYFMDAKQAWYVVDSEKKAAMDKTLASFSKKEDAIAFSKEFGGKVYAFNDIGIALL